MMHFCWLPPERLVIGRAAAGGLDREPLDRLGDGAGLGAAVDQAAAGQRVEAADRDVLGDGHPVEEAERLAVLGHQRDPGGDRLAGAPEADGAAVEEDRARRRDGAGAEEGFEQLGPARAEQPGDAEHLAGVDLERDAPRATAGRCRAGWAGDRSPT